MGNGLNNGAVVLATDGLKENAVPPKFFEPNNELGAPNPLNPAVMKYFSVCYSVYY